MYLLYVTYTRTMRSVLAREGANMDLGLAGRVIIVTGAGGIAATVDVPFGEGAWFAGNGALPEIGRE
jgi:hypothetical protein